MIKVKSLFLQPIIDIIFIFHQSRHINNYICNAYFSINIYLFAYRKKKKNYMTYGKWLEEESYNIFFNKNYYPFTDNNFFLKVGWIQHINLHNLHVFPRYKHICQARSHVMSLCYGLPIWEKPFDVLHSCP